MLDISVIIVIAVLVAVIYYFNRTGVFESFVVQYNGNNYASVERREIPYEVSGAPTTVGKYPTIPLADPCLLNGDCVDSNGHSVNVAFGAVCTKCNTAFGNGEGEGPPLVMGRNPGNSRSMRWL